MKKWGVLIVVLMLILYLGYMFVLPKDIKLLYNTFKNTGASFMRGDVESHGNFRTDDTLESVASNLFKALGFEGNYTISNINEWVELNYKNGDVEIKIKTRKIPDENLTYASVILSQYTLNENINNNIRRTMAEAFEIYKVKPSFSSLIMGRYDDRMSVPQMKESLSKVFSSIGASFVDEMDDRNMVSLTGHVLGVRDRVKVGEKYINLNMALRYSETDGCTYIWIGSPVILTEY